MSTIVPRCLSPFFIVLALLAIPGSAAAVSGPDNSFVALPCRPTVACTADIVPPGMLELEAGYNYRKGPAFTGHTTPFILKFSVMHWLQLQAGGNGMNFVGEDRFFDDLQAGLKFHLLDQGELLPSVSFSATLNIPLREQSDSYTPNYNALFNFYITREKGIVHGDFNFGFNLYQLGGEQIRHQLWAALAVSVALPHSFTLMGELYAMNAAADVAPQDGGFLFALAWAPKPYVVFDIGGDVGFFSETRSFSAFAGVTIIPVSLFNRRSPKS